MTWLIVVHAHDTPALWAANRLRAGGLSQLLVVTDNDLACATWHHRVGDDVTQTVLELANGTVIDSATIRGTLNRFTHVPPAMVAKLAEDDRVYAMQELTALMLSWLTSLSGKVLNPADPRGLSGAWRSPAEWALLATKAGLPCVPIDCSPENNAAESSWHDWPPYAPRVEDVIVVEEAVFSERPLNSAGEEACCNLAKLANTPVLGLSFDNQLLSGVTPLPDLRAGGDALVEALASALAAS